MRERVRERESRVAATMVQYVSSWQREGLLDHRTMELSRLLLLLLSIVLDLF